MTAPGGDAGAFGILISGRGSNMVALVEAARSGVIGARPDVVISNVPDAPGLERARDLGVAVEVVDHRESASREEHDRRVLDLLQGHGVRLVCLAGYMRLLSPVMISAFRAAIMNIHPSLLPAFPGLEAQSQALAHGVKVAGCTVHFVDEELDSGPIILQAAIDVREGDTPEALAARILEQEHRLYPRAVSLFFQDRLEVDGRRVKILSGHG